LIVVVYFLSFDPSSLLVPMVFFGDLFEFMCRFIQARIVLI